MARKKQIPAISDAEWTGMKVLWEQSPRSSRDIGEARTPTVDGKPKTIHTVSARLVRKGAIEVDKDGREYQFSPAVRAEDCQREVTRSFLDRVFDGDVAPFLACFVRDNKLSRAEIAELKRILEKKI